MNKKTVLIQVGTGVGILLIGLIAGRFLIPSSNESFTEHQTHTAQNGVEEATTWTCSMHPQIQQPEPGNCPICGMTLIPVAKDGGSDDGPRTLSMSESSRALADIQTTEIKREFPEAKIRLVGKLDYDETRLKSLTARFPARIDKLFVNFTGLEVTVGQHLAEVYSPDLLSAQRELLTAYRSNPNNSITQAAREKLRLWDLLPDQIEEILNNGEATDRFVLRAPVGGVVVAKNVKEGDYLKTGEPLFKIVDLSRLWLYLDAYESDLAWLRYGQDVAFTVESFPGETFHGQIAFIEPEVNRTTRTVSVRVNVSNTDRRLKPGMFARGEITAKMADGGKVFAPELAGKWISPMHPEIIKDAPGLCDVCGMDLVSAEKLGYVEEIEELPPVIVPASAVLRTGKRAVVYIEIPDTERPTFEGREIVLGSRAGDYFLVAEGLAEGDRVVTQGAFKIDSSLQIQAKPSMMNPEGGGPVPGHNHGGQDTHADMPASSVPQLIIPKELGPKIIAPYLKLQAALAADDLQAAKDQAKAMMEITGHSGPLPNMLHTMLAADSLDALRKPHFDRLSAAMIETVKADSHGYSGDLLVMHCPMVYGSTGADWIQASEPLQNPYFGASMLTCGEVKESLTSHEGHNH
jgi:membrane fusion protein, copper/silver efflux system